jgi:hypothetical protein
LLGWLGLTGRKNTSAVVPAPLPSLSSGSGSASLSSNLSESTSNDNDDAKNPEQEHNVTSSTPSSSNSQEQGHQQENPSESVCPYETVEGVHSDMFCCLHLAWSCLKECIGLGTLENCTIEIAAILDTEYDSAFFDETDESAVEIDPEQRQFRGVFIG